MRTLLDPYDLLPKLKAHELRSLSYSKISTADVCLVQLEYKLDRSIPYVTDEARAKGTAYHAGLEVLYNARKAGEPVVMAEVYEAVRGALTEESETYGFTFNKGSSLDEAVAEACGLINIYLRDSCAWPEGYVIVDVEVEFILPLAEGWVGRGIIDLVLSDGETLYVVDHKTAKKEWNQDKHSHRKTPQPAWYDHWAREIWPGFQQYRFVYDIMTLDGVFERREATPKPHHVEATMEKARRIIALVDAGGPYPPNVSSPLCSAKWCDHWKYCPFGSAFDTGETHPVPRREEVTST